jgi:Carboxypeptidase regulatory-like domain
MECHFRKLGLWIVVLAVLAALIPTTPARADNLYASIRGTVTDPSGAVVPNVKLIATNVATGINYTTTSNTDGAFNFPQLPIGNYTVKSEQTGFKAFQTTPFHLDLNQVYLLNVKLEVGTVSEQLVVEANPVQVNTTDMQLGATVTGQQIVDLPLNGRNWTQLQQLQPGVVAASDRFGQGQNGAFSGNGAETQQNSFLINGTDSNDPTLNTALVIPSPDAIGEFRLVTNTLNPEYGRNSGTIINAAIKNGTNQFHGDAFDFYRDTFLDATAWFHKAPQQFHQNQFGGTIGGPVIKDHTFFFFSYQGLRARQPGANFNGAPTVFSSAERSGDFSADTGGAFPALNPSTGGTAVSPIPLVGEDGVTHPAGTSYATLFPTGHIPAADLNPLAVKLMNQFLPLPNAAGNLFEFNPLTTLKDNQYIYRVDQKIRDADAIWFYGLYESRPSVDDLPFTGATVPGFGETAKRHIQQYTVAWNHTFSPTVLNEARFGYVRFNFAAVEPLQVINPTAYGFTGIAVQDPAVAQLPLMSVNGLFNLGFSNNGPQPRIQNTFQFTDNFSKVMGHHTIKAGVNLDIIRVDNPFFNNHNGNFSYNGAGPFSTGFPGADFLLGLPDSYSQGSGSIVRERGREYYSYVQDQWQVKRNLTLTYGLGWDIETPWRNAFANGEIMSAFRWGQQSKIFPTMPVGFVYPGDPGINKYGGQSIHYDQVAPRVGFAWSPGSSGNWAIRGGVGLYYNRTESELALQSLVNPPFAITSIGGGVCGLSPAFATPFVGYTGTGTGTCTAPQVFPFTPPAPGTSFDPTPFEPIGLSMTVEDPRFTAPRALNYNLTLERQLSKSTIVSVGYVGNIGRHEEGAIVLNNPGQAPGVNPAAAAFGGGSCSTGFILHTPACPQFGQPGGPPDGPLAVYGQTGWETTEFNSNYNSLQVSFNRHFSNGLQILAGYTWSRYFDYTSNLENSAFNFPGINPFDIKHMYGPSSNDAPQRFVVSYTYTLPFYKLGHHWKRVLDDWNISGIYTLQHGFPIQVFNGAQTSLTCDLAVSFFTCPDRANRTGQPLEIHDPRNYTINGKPNYWFNPKAFSVPDPGTGVGDANRNPLYGPGLNYTDMALEKSIHITESKYFQLRLETFNTFNHANFANPATSPPADNVASSRFGRIFAVQNISTQGDGRVLQLGAKFYF